MVQNTIDPFIYGLGGFKLYFWLLYASGYDAVKLEIILCSVQVNAYGVFI